MSSSYEIKLEADDTDLDRTVDRAVDKMDKLQDKASSIEIGASRSRGGGGGSGGGGGGLLPNPWEKYETLSTNLAAARGMGLSEDTVRPLSLATARAQASMERADRMLSPDDGSKPMSIGWGTTVPMLISQAMSKLPSGLLPAIGGLSMGAYVGARIMAAGLGSMNDLGSAYYVGGGSISETGSISSLGRFLGKSAAESAGSAVQFGQSLHNATYGAGYFRSRGLIDFGGITTDKATNYLAAAGMLAEMPSRAEATRVARDTQMSDLLWLRDLPADRRAAVLGGMQDQSSKSERQADAEYKADVGDITSTAESVWRDVVMGVHDILSPSGWRKWFDEASQPGGHSSQLDEKGDPNDDLARAQVVQAWRGGEKGPDRPASVRVQPGQSGGGIRVQEAMPPMARNIQLSQNLRGYADYSGGYYGG